MAGSLYLGSQKVCPAVVLGQPEPPEYDSVIKIPDDVTELVSTMDDDKLLSSYIFTGRPPLSQIKNKILLDLNNVEVIEKVIFHNFANFSQSNIQVNIKAEKLREVGRNCFAVFIQGYDDPNRVLPMFYNPVISFPNLEKAGYNSFIAFAVSGITDIYFPKLKTADETCFSYMCELARDIKLHFASNQESLISSLNGYPTFGSSHTVTILYDQPPTE